MNLRNNSRPGKVWHVKNERIQAPELRVLDEAGKQIGIMSRQEALATATVQEKDLILITEAAQPPVAKIIEFNKFLYQEQKKAQEARKGVKKSQTKDVQLSVFIAEGDRERLKNKAKEFLQEGFQVRVKLLLRGREMGKREMAFERITQFINGLEDAQVSSPPRMQGRIIFAVLTRKKKS